MELISIVALLFWSWLGYFVARKVKDNHPNFNIEPVLYGVGAFLIGFIWVMLFLGIKYLIWNKQNN